MHDKSCYSIQLFTILHDHISWDVINVNFPTTKYLSSLLIFHEVYVLIIIITISFIFQIWKYGHWTLQYWTCKNWRETRKYLIVSGRRPEVKCYAWMHVNEGIYGFTGRVSRLRQMSRLGHARTFPNDRPNVSDISETFGLQHFDTRGVIYAQLIALITSLRSQQLAGLSLFLLVFLVFLDVFVSSLTYNGEYFHHHGCIIAAV